MDLATLPLYVRAGAIIPLDPVRQFTAQAVSEPTELRIYPGANGDYTLYDDDGQSLDYLKTDGSRIRLQWNDAAQTLTIEPMNEAARQIKRTFKLRLQPGGETTSIEYGGTKTTTRPAK